MALNAKNIKKILLLSTFAIVLFWAVQNLSQVIAAGRYVLNLASPFLIGLAVAFVLSVPIELIERAFTRPRKNGRPLCTRGTRWLRPVSLLLSGAFVVALIGFVLLMVIPQLIDTVRLLADAIIAYLPKTQEWFNQLDLYLADYPEYQEMVRDLVPSWQNIVNTVASWLTGLAGTALSSSVGAATTIFNGVFDTFLTIVFAIYVSVQKERLARQCKQLLYAFLPERWVDRTIEVARLTHDTFFSFVTVQCTEATILGALCFIGMTIFRFPHALPITVMLWITALIPIFGALISTILGAFLILVINPIQALWFVLFIIVLQQIESNLIYPRVVSASPIGLPAIWVLLAVTVGGSLMGVLGMLVAVPTTSVVYTLVKRSMHARLEQRHIDAAKIWRGRSGAERVQPNRGGKRK